MKPKHLVALGVAAFVVYKLAKKAPAPAPVSTNGVGVIYAPGGTDVIMAEQFGGLHGLNIKKAFKSATNSLRTSLKSAIKLPLVAVTKPLTLPKAMVETLPSNKVMKVLTGAAAAPLILSTLSTVTAASGVKALVTGKSVKSALIKPTAGVIAAAVPPKTENAQEGVLLDCYENPITQARYNQLLADMNANGGQAYGLVDAAGKQFQVTKAEYEAAVAAAEQARAQTSAPSGPTSPGTSYTTIVDPNTIGPGGVTYSNQMPDGMQQQAEAPAAEQQPQVPAEAQASAPGGFSAGLALVGGGIAAAFMAFAKK